MITAARSTFATGVAFVGASAIALSPVQPVSPFGEHLSAAPAISAAVDLTASANPYLATFRNGLVNVENIGIGFVLNPAPAARQFALNVSDYVGTATSGFVGAGQATVKFWATDLPEAIDEALVGIALGGTLSEAINTIVTAFQTGIGDVVTPLIPVFNLPAQIAQNAANVFSYLSDPDTVNNLVKVFSDPFLGAAQAMGDSFARLVTDAQGGDFAAAGVELLNLPGYGLDAYVNGYKYNDDTSYLGVLSAIHIVPLEGGDPGLVQTLTQSIPAGIADAIKPSGDVAPSASAKAAPKSAAALQAADEAAAADSDSNAGGAATDSEGPATSSTGKDKNSAGVAGNARSAAVKASGGGKGHSRSHGSAHNG